MTLRGHEPLPIPAFNGLYKRGGVDSCPPDHFSDCNNIKFTQTGIETRDGIGTYLPYDNVLHQYTYVQQTGQSLLVLVEGGLLYDTGSPTPFVPILAIPAMVDFAFVAIAGRAYISPHDGVKGLQNQYVYIYLGDGSPARRAGGDGPVNGVNRGSFFAYDNPTPGTIVQGIHIFAVSFISAGPVLSNFGLGTAIYPVVLSPGSQQIMLANLPIGPPGTIGRLICVTKVINVEDYNPDPTGYVFYELATINDNISNWISVNFAEADLVIDRSVLNTSGGGFTATFSAINSETGNPEGSVDVGFRIFAAAYETDTGFITRPGPEFFAMITSPTGLQEIFVQNIPISPNGYIIKRRLLSTKIIENYNGNQTGYQFFFVPDGTLENNTSTQERVKFFDADLIDDASYLFDQYVNIPAGVNLTTYHGRLCVNTTYTDISIGLISKTGEPESIDQITGLVIFPLDGNPMTAMQEFRDILYGFKQTRTAGWSDNGDEPSSWPLTILDQGIGASVHGVAQVLDTGGVNIDYLEICDYSGVMLFNGTYIRPELSWKIRDLWLSLDRSAFKNIQILNDSLAQFIYITLPNRQMLFGDYSNGLDAKNIKWTPWGFDILTNTIALIDTNKLIIGSQGIV